MPQRNTDRRSSASVRAILYNEVLQGWKDEAEWVLKDKVWDKVTFDNLFTTTVESTETTETTESSTTDNAVTENTEAVEGTESVQ